MLVLGIVMLIDVNGCKAGIRVDLGVRDSDVSKIDVDDYNWID